MLYGVYIVQCLHKYNNNNRLFTEILWTLQKTANQTCSF